MNQILNQEELLRQVIEDIYAETVCSRNVQKSIEKIRDVCWNTMDTLDLQEKAQKAVDDLKGITIIN